MFEVALVTRLATLAPNAYPLAAPLGYVTPAVVYNRLHTEPYGDLSNGNATVASLIVQIDVYDPDYSTAKATAKAIRNDLTSWKDADVQSVSWTGESDMIDDTTDVSLYRTMLTFVIVANDP